MKKSNKLSVGYVITSALLLVFLLGGGVYGIYVSVGLNFVRSSVSNVTDGVAGGVSNVSYGGAVNFSPNMTGVIILSIVLVLLAIFDIVALIKQVVFFKQFQFIKESKFEKGVERKVKSKGSVVFLVCVVDILSIIAGIAGVFVNVRSFAGNNLSWVLYVIDGMVAILALISLILLFAKLKKIKNLKPYAVINKSDGLSTDGVEDGKVKCENHSSNKAKFDIDELEYCLLKMRHLKTSRLISGEEYEILRNKVIEKPKSVEDAVDEQEKNKAN